MRTKLLTITKNRVLAIVLTIAALVVGQSARAQWTGEGLGTSSVPYEISNYAQLKEFANIVNSMDNPDVCAKLVNDIVCKNGPEDEGYATDWIPIGNSTHKYTGIFDGQENTIIGLSTGTDNTSDYVGLFGYIGSGGVVQNVTLENATITGNSYVGVIVGYNTGNLTDNYYLGCSVTNAIVTNATTNIGTGSGDCDGARGKHTITWKDGDGNTLKEELVASGQTPEYSGATPTKTATAQYSYEFNDSWDPEIVPVTGDATYTALFDATENPIVAYIDANGNVHDDLTGSTETTDDDGVQAIPLKGTETVLGQSGETMWYVVPDNVADPDAPDVICGNLTLNGSVNLILKDDQRMAAANINGVGKVLNIYGQSSGTGKLTVGTIGADVNHYGAQVTASTIYSDVTLAWTTPNDYLFATNFEGTVTIAANQVFQYSEGENTAKVMGTVSDISAIRNQYLLAYGYGGYCGLDDETTTDVDESKDLTWEIPFVDHDNDVDTPVQLSTTQRIVGSGDMADYTTVDAPWKGYSKDLILVDNEAAYNTCAPKLNDGDKAKLAPNEISLTKNDSGWGTYCHNYPVSYSLDLATAFTISGLSSSGQRVTITAINDNVVAPRTPLLLGYTVPDGIEHCRLTALPSTATVLDNTNAIVSTTFEGGSFYGNCSNTIVSPGDFDGYYDEGQTYLLYNGMFIQADTNGGLGAHKCLLVLSGTNNAPLLMINKETTSLTSVTSLMGKESECFYTLDGRKLDKQPTAKGIYISNRKKVVIK